MFPSGCSACVHLLLHYICSVGKGWRFCVCVCSCSPPSAVLMTSQLLRGLPRTQVLASTLIPCKQHQSQPRGVPHQPASRWPFCLWQNCHFKCYNTAPVLHSYILTPPQVNSILKANEYSFKVCGCFLFSFQIHSAKSSSASPTFPTSSSTMQSLSLTCCLF